MDDLLTINQACDILKVHPNTLRNWDKSGHLCAIRIGVRGDRRYKKSEVIDMLTTDTHLQSKAPTVLDLFAGCGGLSYGFEQAGYSVLAGIDNWDDALKTFKYNHRSADIYNLDLFDFDLKEFEQKANYKGKVDIIVGGPPCQGFSIAGHRLKDDPRNSLYKAFVDFVEYYKPKVFLLENVPNLLAMDGGSIRDGIVKDFEELGYTVVYKKLLASDYGVPQARRRVVFVGVLEGDAFQFPEPTHNNPVSSKDAISDLSEQTLDEGAEYTTEPHSEYQSLMRKNSKGVYNHVATVHTDQTRKIIALVPDGGNYKNLPKELWDTRKVNIAWTRINSGKPSMTIDTGHNHHFHYSFNRVPTARESARLQSFPDNFVFLGGKTSQLKQIGNAVPPLMAKRLAEEIKEQYEL